MKIFLVFILMSTPLFCVLIPYMGNREVCLEYCTGIRSKPLLQLPVEWESAPFLTEKMAVVLELALEQQVSAASVIAWLAKKENEVNE